MPRSVRFWTTAQAAGLLEQLAYLERASAHILAGWIVKTPRLEIKTAWGEMLAANMEHAARLHERAGALRAGRDEETSIPARWRDAAQAIDAAEDTTGVLCGLLRLRRGLAAQYDEYVRRADPVADAASLRIVASARRAAASQVKWLSRRAPVRLVPWPKPRGPQIPWAEGLWEPLSRVPRVARPPELARGEPGALRRLPLRPRARKDTGLFLHNFLNEEYATLELVARNSYEHPEMPLAFHRDAARHAGDEARHARLFTRALPEYGTRYGDYPIYTYSYEGEYEFEPCAPGSRRELLWRLLLRQVVHEGLALDSTAFEIRKRQYLRQPELARLFGYILADEVFHAGSGLKWSRYLVGGDEAALRRERDEAYAYYAARLKERRLTWGATHLAEAAAEAEQLEQVARNYHFPFHGEVNVAARRRAGFGDEDIRRVREAGI